MSGRSETSLKNRWRLLQRRAQKNETTQPGEIEGTPRKDEVPKIKPEIKPPPIHIFALDQKNTAPLESLFQSLQMPDATHITALPPLTSENTQR